ncbi:glycoside hydrolase family 35 protein [Hypholoma sublateritium FD-334 SS-4]|uniref:Beta-galactosidase n=1 Tax=Hypholoma sublateritium (strain FD-334 SS-4) TaxID=945553 RepID=A0A0D2MIK2_HYPSF|nr:glycoside hydrolase family 35 protein [Hypholoma sublateritium FD-334 SS-4]
MIFLHAMGFFALCVAAIPSSLASIVKRNSTGLTNAVTWDPHSLSIQGQRIFILSAEFHPWRLPGNPDIWGDIFQKIKSNGFNTVSFYVNWAVHYPTPGTNGTAGDFQTGTYRDIQRFIDEAKQAGLWLIARVTIITVRTDAETTGGGFPGWVGNIGGSLRANNANYTQAWTPYLTAITKILARNQITNGGPIILVQAENEYSASASNDIYMQAVINTYRAGGIVVPITFNDQHAGSTGNFSPDKPGTHVDIYCGDSYPQGANSWAQVQAVYYSNHEGSAPSDPLCLAEFGGGFLLGWGAAARGGTGYEKYSNGLTDATYEDVFYKENYAQTTTILNIYMIFGGTNWGQTMEPTVYTSYDYGGGINEGRVATPKMNEMRLQGLFLRVSRDLLGATLIANGTNYTTSSLIHTAELRNINKNAGFYFMRHDTSTSTALTTTQVTINTSAGSLLIPLTGFLTFNGREAKILVTDYIFGQNQIKILYSTAEIMTWTTIDSNDYIIIYAPTGQTGETAIELSNPVLDLSPFPNVTAKFVNGLLTLNFDVGGSQIIPVQNGNDTLFVIIMDKTTANTWHAPVISNANVPFGNYFSVGTNTSILVGGPYVLRDASISGSTLALEGDLNGTTTVQAIVPKDITQIIWNKATIQTSINPSGSHLFSAIIGGASTSLQLPSLANWKVSGSFPEVDPNFDDSGFTTATLTTTNYTNLPPLAGEIVLYSQQYGFYGGNLIFRGYFTASGAETAIVTTVQSGFAGGYSAWLNGVFLGSSQGNSTVSVTTDTWVISFSMLRINSNNVFVIIQDHMGIVETSTSSGKEPRGIRGYKIIGGNATFNLWKIQGNQGGAASAPDTFRGYLNEGGLYAERVGAHLPGFPDTNWASGTPLTGGGVHGAGVNFFRTTFDLNIPNGVDMPVRLSITPSAITSNFRVQIYLNGWQVGKYINNIGPQTLFVLPAGILRRQSTNTLALSLWSLDAAGASIAGLSLVSDGTFSTSFQFNDYQSPDYTEQQNLRPAATFFQPM